ncbi:unnamed protein product [Toxocara canis]|uniref:Uncharacterized protein n=1 Tax=Toxocara canis TaxID=6265 RepID=A0A183UV83_TOXCA|nr:unnamed protein product [Toxocara canis]
MFVAVVQGGLCGRHMTTVFGKQLPNGSTFSPATQLQSCCLGS